MDTRNRPQTKRKRRVQTDAADRAGEAVGRRIVFIRDNKFVTPRPARRAAS